MLQCELSLAKTLIDYSNKDQNDGIHDLFSAFKI